MEPLIAAWRQNNGLNLYLLEQITDGQLDLQVSKCKSIRGHFAHLVNVRRMKLKMMAKELLDCEDKADRRHASRSDLIADLESSSQSIAALLSRASDPGEKLKGSPGTAATVFAALIAHEANHRGQIEATLRICDAELSDTVQIRLSEWHLF